ncbi:MAG: tRNA (N6-threonylcarbamoyladenosine(37)-N6)-methyltransferase TrmO [Gammaproteobacteria bacterium]|nr:tRNA (N6-threonylcarbamoyladenosine(37)-N6)-methyltransferase TrmO [Gammaproteobacteria bacterium]
MEKCQFDVIGVVRSPFSEKFGVPRQPGLVPAARFSIEFRSDYDRPEAFRGLDEFSHVWLVFLFHQALRGQWKPTVRPPRLGGNERVGVFASRSPFRPNAIGLSSATLLAVEQQAGRTVLQLAGLDLVDGTPVLDIKPYIAYADSHPGARSGFAATVPALVPVRWRESALSDARVVEQRLPGFVTLVEQVLAQDPRPAYIANDADRDYGTMLYDVNVSWRVVEFGSRFTVEVLSVNRQHWNDQSILRT